MADDICAIYTGMDADEIETSLYCEVLRRLQSKYGKAPDLAVKRRVEDEWTAMEQSDMLMDTTAIYEITQWLKANHYPYWMKGPAGSGFILYLLDITSGDPLPPHCYCPVCKSVYWMPTYANGFDIPQDKICDNDGSPLVPDGHNIPWQTLWGYDNFHPILDIELPIHLYEFLQTAMASHWLRKLNSEAVFSTSQEEVKHIRLSNLNLTFTVDFIRNTPNFSAKRITAADRPLIMRNWKSLVHFSPFQDTDKPEPACVADIISFVGLKHSIGVWDMSAALMLSDMGYSLLDMIIFRDDIFHYLLDHDYIEKDAWKGMSRVRKGLELRPISDAMKYARDKWVLDRCRKIEYLFPKTHVVEQILFSMNSQVFHN